jgi:hypothetical protein
MKLTRKKLRGLIIESLTESSHDLSDAQKLKQLMQLDPDMTSRDRDSFVQATDLAGTLEDHDPEIIDMYQDLASGFDSVIDAHGSDLTDKINDMLSIGEDYIIFKEEDVSFGYYDGNRDQVSLDSEDRKNYGPFEAGFNRLPQGSGVIVMDVVNGIAYLDEDLYYIMVDYLEFQIDSAIDAANEYSRDNELAEDHWFELENYMTTLMHSPFQSSGEIYIPFDYDLTLQDYQTAAQFLKFRSNILGTSPLDPVTQGDIDAVMQTKPF